MERKGLLQPAILRGADTVEQLGSMHGEISGCLVEPWLRPTRTTI